MAENYRARSSDAPAVRILLIAGDDECARELREPLLTFIPTAVVARLDTETLSVGELPATDGVMIDVGATRGTVEAFRTLRGRGFEGGLPDARRNCSEASAARGDDPVRCRR